MKVLSSSQNEPLYEGEAEVTVLPHHGFEVRMQNDTYTGSWRMSDKGVVLRHASEGDVSVYLRPKGKCLAVVEHEYGRFELPVRLDFYDHHNNPKTVRYYVEGNEDVFEFQLYIEETEKTEEKKEEESHGND